MSSTSLFESLEARQLLATFIVNTLDDIVNVPGMTSLRDAIGDSNTSPGADVIEFAEGLTGRIDLDSFGITLNIRDDVTINGPGPNQLTVSAGGLGRVFFHEENATSTINGIAITGGQNSQGAGIFNQSGSLTLNNVRLASNSGEYGAGVINYADLTITNSTIRFNSAQFAGGAISNIGTLSVSDSAIFENSTAGAGGASVGGALDNVGTATLSNVEIHTNSATGDGGAIANRQNASLTLTNSQIWNNEAAVTGGAIWNLGNLSISGSAVFENSAGANAGGIENQSTATITGTEIRSNTAASDGGGIRNYGNLTLSLSTVAFNQAGASGGGLWLANSSTITSTDIDQNSASVNGGGIYFIPITSGTLAITSSSINSNTATQRGGGIYALEAGVTISTSTIAQNDAEFGGGLFGSEASVTVTSSTIATNTAMNGGGLYLFRSMLDLVNSTVSGNSASNVGGGLLFTSSTIQTNPASIRNSTITANTAQNGGAILFESPISGVYLESTIVAGNPTSSGNELFGSFDESSANNLFSESNPQFTNGVNGNIVGADPLLGPLADNGGPTQTHLLMEGSPAINAGSNPGSLASDQRGESRSRGATDIGSVEFQPAQPQAGVLVLSRSGVLPQGEQVTLEYLNSNMSPSALTRFDFFVDSNDNGTAETDELIASGSDYRAFWSIPIQLPELTQVRFIAIAYDEFGQATSPISSIGTTPAEEPGEMPNQDDFITWFQNEYALGLSNDDRPLNELFSRVPEQRRAYSMADWSAENHWFQGGDGNVWALWHGGGVHAVAGGQHRWVLTNLSEAGGLNGLVGFAPGSMSGVIASWGAFSIQGIIGAELVSFWWSPESSRLQWGNNENGWVLTQISGTLSSVLRDAETGQPLTFNAPAFRDYTQTQRNGRFTFEPDATPQLGGGMSIAVVAHNGDVYVVTFSTLRQPAGQPAPALPNLWLLERLELMPGALAGSFDPIAAGGQYRIASGLT